jgi:hypothetical protein
MGVASDALPAGHKKQPQAAAPHHETFWKICDNGQVMFRVFASLATRSSAASSAAGVRCTRCLLHAPQRLCGRYVAPMSTAASAAPPTGSPGTRDGRRVVYNSTSPLLVRLGCSLLTLKAAVAVVGSGSLGVREVRSTLRSAEAASAGTGDGAIDWFALWSGELSVPLPVRCHPH